MTEIRFEVSVSRIESFPALHQTPYRRKGEKRIARHKEGKRAVSIPPLPLFLSPPILSPLSPNGAPFHGLSCE